MAQMADTQKVIARMELDKLHRGLVVELDRRLVKPVGREAAEPVPLDLVEVSQAIEVVQETMTTLKNLKDRSEEQSTAIRNLENDRSALSVELRQVEARLEEASQKIATLEEGSAQDQKTIDSLEGERANLVASNGKLKADLTMLVESVMNSFVKHRDVSAEPQAQDA